MWRAALVHIHLEPGVLGNERPGCARVIEVDVGQHEARHIGDRESRCLKRTAKRRQRARRAGIDERDAARAVEHRGRDDPWAALEIQIDERDA